ncbi:MAG: hypothetical protein HUU49_00095 [Candidatus Buchananbacteria bacterium]|nr:hypothetical protein [Candidatus Buchananbacteria bacterium]
MPNSLQKIIDLIKQTGDNCIVLDHEGNPAYVLMTLADYQKMVIGRAEVAGLSEEELIDKINRDIASWKASSQQEEIDNWQAVTAAIDSITTVTDKNLLNKAKINQEADAQSSDENKYYFEPVD